MESDFSKVHLASLPNKETIAYRQQLSPSSKHTIICLHGQTSTSIIYDEIFLLFQNEPLFSLYALDMRGFGNSTMITPLSSFKDLADDIFLFIEKLSLKNVTLAGISTGGVVSMVFAAQYPDAVRNIILLDSVSARGIPLFKSLQSKEMITSFEDLKKGDYGKFMEAFYNKNIMFFASHFKATCYNVGKAPNPVKGVKNLQEMFKQKHVLEIFWLLHNFNITDEYNGVCQGTGEFKKIQCRVLIIHGDKDVLVPLKEAVYTHKLLGDKISTLVVMKECGHVPIYSESEKTAKYIRDFVLQSEPQAKL